MVKEFTDFPDVGAIQASDKLVGTRANVNIQVNFDSGIKDADGNYMFGYSSSSNVASNYIKLTNAVSGSPAIITAAGADTNVSINLLPKGDGHLSVSTSGLGDIKLDTQSGYIKINGTAPLYGFTTDDTFAAASDFYVSSSLAVKTYVDIIAGGLRDLTYITSTDETENLPNSFQLLGTANEIEVNDGVINLPLNLTLPGSMTVDNGEINLVSGSSIVSTNQDLNLVPDGGYAVTLQTETVSIQKDLIHELESDNKLSFTTGVQTYYIGGTEQFRINSSGLRVKSNLSISDSQISTSTGDLTISPFANLNLYGNGDLSLLSGLSGGAGNLSLIVNGSGNFIAETDNGNIGFNTTSGVYTFAVASSSIMDLSSSGFRLGMGYRVSTISNDAAAYLDTELMTAYAIQTAIGNAIIGSNNFRGGWDASGGLFPTTGGTGPAGAVAAGNNWRISVAGTLGGEPVDQGDQIIAATAVPGQTAANWIIVNPRVSSVFGRTGSVVAVSGDYSYGQITGLPATATSGKLMRGNGSAWAETTATYPDTATSAGKILRADGANWVASTPTFPNTATSGKIMRGDGTNWIESTPTYPNTANTGKIMRGDGTNWVETTAQYPAAAGTAGNILTSDGTNWISSGPQNALMMMAPTNQSGTAFNFSLSYQEIRGMAVAFTLVNGTSNFDMPLEGRLRYIGADPITLWFGFVVLAPSADWSFALYKNATTQLVAVNMTGMSPCIHNYKIDLVQNDYISIFGKRFAGTGNAAMYNIQLFCSS